MTHPSWDLPTRMMSSTGKFGMDFKDFQKPNRGWQDDTGMIVKSRLGKANRQDDNGMINLIGMMDSCSMSNYMKTTT